MSQIKASFCDKFYGEHLSLLNAVLMDLEAFSQFRNLLRLNKQVQIYLAVLAGWMNRKQQKVIEYLLEENQILKQQFESTGKKLRLDNHQRRNLAKRGKAMGWAQLQQYATLVRPETILAWHRKLVALKYTAKRMLKTDRQKRMEVIQGLCVQFAEENMSWGYGRIQGALSNLGYKVSMTTVGNILRARGIVPSPERGKQSNWKTFVRSLYGRDVRCRFFHGGSLDSSWAGPLPRIFCDELGEASG